MTNPTPSDRLALALCADRYDQPVQCVVAAALRTVADQVICSVPPPCADVDEFAKGFLAAHVKYRREILAIAAELEGQALPQPPTQPTKKEPC